MQFTDEYCSEFNVNEHYTDDLQNKTTLASDEHHAPSKKNIPSLVKLRLLNLFNKSTDVENMEDTKSETPAAAKDWKYKLLIQKIMEEDAQLLKMHRPILEHSMSAPEIEGFAVREFPQSSQGSLSKHLSLDSESHRTVSLESSLDSTGSCIGYSRTSSDSAAYSYSSCSSQNGVSPVLEISDCDEHDSVFMRDVSNHKSNNITTATTNDALSDQSSQIECQNNVAQNQGDCMCECIQHRHSCNCTCSGRQCFSNGSGGHENYGIVENNQIKAALGTNGVIDAKPKHSECSDVINAKNDWQETTTKVIKNMQCKVDRLESKSKVERSYVTGSLSSDNSASYEGDRGGSSYISTGASRAWEGDTCSSDVDNGFSDAINENMIDSEVSTFLTDVSDIRDCCTINSQDQISPSHNVLRRCQTTECEHKTSLPLTAEVDSTVNSDVFKSTQDTSHVSNGQVLSDTEDTYKRFYHVFREGELTHLIEKYVDCLHVVEEFYDHANWCVIAEKVDVWKI